jgi:protease IV
MHYVKLELAGRYQEIGFRTMSPREVGKKYFRLDLFYMQIERILEIRPAPLVIIERQKGFSVPAFGGLEEIRAALQRLKDAGITVYYYAPEFDLTDCLLSSACKHRILHPLGQVSFPGMAMPSLFFKKLLDNHQVDVTVIRRDRYKSAADTLRTEKYDRYARSQYQALLDGLMAILKDTVMSSSEEPHGFTSEMLDSMIAGRILTAPEALESGLVDDLRTFGDITNEWEKKGIKRRSVKRRRFRFGSVPRVAVLVLEGMIVDGDDRRNPLFGPGTGDRSIIRYIRALKNNPRIRAVVFRINSGGGSATASENILRELAALHEKKPLVISMGPVAGSGGYWISATGRRLFALPTTITGSIGVLTLYFNIARLLEKYGITTDCIRHGDSADLGSAYRPLTEKEHRTISSIVEFLYQEFISRVAGFRKISPEKVHKLGEGRIWLGKEAVRHNLVDETGGLHDAVAFIKGIIGAKEVRISFEPRQPYIVRLLARWRTNGNLMPEIEEPACPGAEAFTRTLASLNTGGAAAPGFTAPQEIARACLAVHGQLLFIDPLLLEFFKK